MEDEEKTRVTVTSTSSLSNWRRKDWRRDLIQSESILSSHLPSPPTLTLPINIPTTTSSVQQNVLQSRPNLLDPVLKDNLLPLQTHTNPWSTNTIETDLFHQKKHQPVVVTPAIISDNEIQSTRQISTSFARFSSPATSVASLYASLVLAPEETSFPFTFPFVALTRADERALINLLIVFKTANDRFQSSLSMSPSAWQGNIPEKNSNLPLDAVIPEQNSSAKPFLLLTNLFLEDFPAEVFLSCPQILSHLLNGISQAESDAPAASRAVFSAAATALLSLLTKLDESLLRLARLNSSSGSLPVNGQSLVPSSPCDDDISNDDTRDTTIQSESATSSAISISLAHKAAVTIARYESRVAVKRLATGLPLDAGKMKQDSNSSSNDETEAVNDIGDEIETTLPSLSSRLGFHYRPYVSPTQEAHVERYFSLRYRYPPSPIIDNGTAQSQNGGGLTTESLELIGGLPPLSTFNQADLLDSPIPVSRFASVTLESCFVAAKYPQRVPSLVRIIQKVVPLAFDRLLLSKDPSVWTKEAAYIAQRILDAAAEACFSLQATAASSSFSVIDTVFDDSKLDPYASRNSSSRSVAASQSLSETIEQSVMAHARCFRNLEPACRCLISALIDLFSSLPVDVLVNEDAHSRHGLWPDGSGGVDNSTLAEGFHAVGLYPTRIRLRRAAMARVCGKLVVPSSLVCFLVGALCCADAEAAGDSDDMITSKRRKVRDGSKNEYDYDLDNRPKEALSKERASLAALIDRIAGPTLAAAVIAGREVVRDSHRLNGALRIAERAAQAQTSVISITGFSATSLSPAAAGFSAFVLYMDASDATVTSRSIETAECTSEAALSVARRVARLLLYADADPSGHGFGLSSFTIPAKGLSDADPNTRFLLASSVTKLCTLSATAASAPGHFCGGTAAAAQHLLRLLLLHPHASIRRAAYAASARILSRPDSSKTVSVSRDNVKQSSMVYALLGSTGEKALAVAAASGVADCDAGVRSVAASFLASALRCSTSTSSLSPLLIRDACTCALAQSEYELSSVDVAVLRDELDHPFKTNMSLSIDLLSVVRALFDPSEHVRLNASVEALKIVTKNQDYKRQQIIISDSSLTSDLELDPAVFLSNLYTSSDTFEVSPLPLHPISLISVLVPDDIVSDEASIKTNISLSENHPYSPISSNKDVKPDALIVPLDPSPAALSVLLYEAQKRARPTRFETAIAFAGQQLPQLEELLQAPNGTMPIEAKASTAEQLAHVLLASAPVPMNVQSRLASRTLEIVATCTRNALDALNHSNINTLINDPRDGSAETKMESWRRLLGALGVLFEAISSVSSSSRARIRKEEYLQKLLLELMYFGGQPLQIQTLTHSDKSKTIQTATDARLCALRSLARSVFEAGMTDIPSLHSDSLEEEEHGPHLDRTPVFTRLSSAFSDIVTGPRCSVANVLVDIVTWNSRPLLRSRAFWGGPAALVPAVATDPSVRNDNIFSNPTVLSAFLVSCGSKGILKAPISMQSKVQGHKYSRGNPETVETLRLAKSYSSNLIAVDLIRHLSSAQSHEAYISALNYAKEACLADKNGCVSFALLRAQGERTNNIGSLDEAKRRESTSESALLLALRKILRGGIPSSDEDRFALAATFEFLTAIMSAFALFRAALDEEDEEDAELEMNDNTSSRLSPPYCACDKERALIDAVCREAAPLLRASIALTDIEIANGENAIVRHISHKNQENEEGKVSDVFQKHPISEIENKIGRAEMLADSLRRSEYQTLERDVSSSRRGFFSKVSRNFSLSLSSRDDEFDLCFPPSRCSLLSATLSFATAAASAGIGGAIYADDETEDDGLPSSYARSGIAATAMHCITILQHPLTGFRERLLSVRLIQALIVSCDTKAASLECAANVRFKSLQDNTNCSVYSAAVRTLVRSCTSRISPALDSFQHKALLKVGQRCLLYLSSPRVACLVDNRIKRLDWCDRSAYGSFGWIWRVCSDREALVRANSYKLISRLISSKSCFTALATEETPAAHLMQLVANSVRHATATVVSKVEPEDIFNEGKNTFSMNVASTAHDDSWDAEAPCVRVACSDVVSSFAKASNSITSNSNLSNKVRLSLQTLLHSLDFEARVRLALRNLGKVYKSPCGTRSGDVTAALLLATLSVTEAETKNEEDDTISTENMDEEEEEEKEGKEIKKVARAARTVSQCRLLHSLLADPQARNGLLVACGAGGPPLYDLLTSHERLVGKSIETVWNSNDRLHLALYGTLSNLTTNLRNNYHQVHNTWSSGKGARAAQYRVARSTIHTRTAALKLFRKYLALDVPSLPLRLRRFHAQAALGLGISAVVDAAALLHSKVSANSQRVHSMNASTSGISVPFSVQCALREGCLFVASTLTAWEQSVQLNTDSFSSSRHHPLILLTQISSNSTSTPQSQRGGQVVSKNPGSPGGGSPKRNAITLPLTKEHFNNSETGITPLLTLNGSSTQRATELLAQSLSFIIGNVQNSLDVRLAGAQAVCALASSLRWAMEVDDTLHLTSFDSVRKMSCDPVGFLRAASSSDSTLTSAASLSTELVLFLLELSGDSSFSHGAEDTYKDIAQTFSTSLFSGSHTLSMIVDSSVKQNQTSVSLLHDIHHEEVVESSMSVVSSVRGGGGGGREMMQGESAEEFSNDQDSSTVLSIDSGFEARALSSLPPMYQIQHSLQEPFSQEKRQSLNLSNSSVDVSKVAGPSPSLIEAGQIMQSVFRPTISSNDKQGKDRVNKVVEDSGLKLERTALLGEVYNSLGENSESALSIEALYTIELDRLRELKIQSSLIQQSTFKLGGSGILNLGGPTDLNSSHFSNLINDTVQKSHLNTDVGVVSSMVGVKGGKTARLVSNKVAGGDEAISSLVFAQESASRLSSLSAARSIVSRASAALLDCSFVCSVADTDNEDEKGFQVTLGLVASDSLTSEAHGAHLLLRLIQHIRRACAVLRQVDADFSLQKCSRIAALLLALNAADALINALRVVTAALLPRPPEISASATVAMQLDVGGTLRECLESAASLARLTSSFSRPETISNTAMALVSSVAHAAINVCGSSEELSSSLVSSGYLSLCVSESAFITSVCLKSGQAQNSTIPTPTSTQSCVGFFAKSFGGSTSAMQKLNDELCSCLIAAASTSSHCRRAIVQKGIVNSIAEILQKRLSPPNSLHLIQHLPLRAIEQALNVLAALVVPSSSVHNEDASIAVLRATGLLDALERLLLLHIPSHTATTSTQLKLFEEIKQSLANTRGAAASLLSVLASLHGRDEWAARPDLLKALCSSTSDRTLKVRSKVALTILELAKQPSSRIRVALRDANVEREIVTVLAKNSFDNDDESRKNLEEVLKRLKSI